MEDTYRNISAQFSDPDRIYRPLRIVHNTFPKIGEQDAYISHALKTGLGGFVLTMGVSREDALPDRDAELRRDADVYMQDADGPDWERMRVFIDKCYAAGLKIWLYDEDTYPSGMAADKVIACDPDYQVRGLVCQAVDCGGGEGSAEMDGGRFLYAAAYPRVDRETIRLAGAEEVTAEDGRLRWNLPQGDWRVLAFYTKKIAYGTYFGKPYPDMLRRDVVRQFVEITHERYIRYLGEDRVRKMEAIFTDEPSVATHGCSSWFDEKNAVAAWTDSFEQDFPARFGYDLFPHLPEFFYATETDYGRVRRDYWRLTADTFAENFFGQIGEWCAAHGIESTGHLYGEETLGMQIGLNGDLFGLHCRMQMPGVDRLYATEPRDVIPEKTASSAMHLMGGHRTMSESSFHFETTFWDQNRDILPENMINSCFYQYVLGINNITSYYPLDSFDDRDVARWTAAVGRTGSFTANGQHRASALVLIPMNAAWERYQPRSYKYWTVGPTTVSRWQTPALKSLEKLYGDTLLRLMDSRHDFDLIDEPHLEMLSAENGRVSNGRESYDTLVLFAAGEPDAGTLDRIRGLLRAGCRAELLRVGESFAEPWAGLLREFPGQVVPVDRFEDVCGQLPPQLFIDADASVWVRHSLLDGRDVYLVHNRADTERSFPVDWEGEAEMFWPLTGRTEKTAAQDGSFDLRLPAKSAVILVR